MGKYVVYLSMLGLLVCLACSEDKKIGEVETLTLDYELPQGKSPADDRIVEIYEKYGSYILYEYTDSRCLTLFFWHVFCSTRIYLVKS